MINLTRQERDRFIEWLKDERQCQLEAMETAFNLSAPQVLLESMGVKDAAFGIVLTYLNKIEFSEK